jgi:hypothetical protein
MTVQLKEFSITPSTISIPAGQVTFNAENVGGVTHEMVIIRTDDAPDALPTEKDGTANEDAKGLTNIDEVEDIDGTQVPAPVSHRLRHRPPQLDLHLGSGEPRRNWGC